MNLQLTDAFYIVSQITVLPLAEEGALSDVKTCVQCSWLTELNNVEEWTKANNLTLSRGKSAKIVIIDRKRKCHDIQPSSLPDICRVSAIKILGVTISN